MGKTLTHIEYLEKLKNKNIDVFPLEEYKGTDIKILHQCSCGESWNVKPANVLQGKHCKECQKKSISNKLRISHEEFLQRHLHQINSNVELIGEYYDKNSKIQCKCLICGEKFDIDPDSLTKGHMHKSCANKIAGINKRYSQEEFLQIAQNNNPTIEIIGIYTGMDNPISVKCHICGHEWSPTGRSIKAGEGCPKCAGLIVTEEDFYERAKKGKKDSVKIVGRYQNSNTKIDCICEECRTPFELKPHQIYSGVGCKKCADKRLAQLKKKSHIQFMQELREINSDILILSEYEGANKHIHCLCLKCSNIWSPVAGSLINQKTGCPECAESLGERVIASILRKNEISYISQKTYSDLLGINYGELSYDFYLPYYNKLIEFQGEQHERPIEYFGGEESFIIQQEHDKRKREYALSHNIKLIEIWYYSFQEIEQILSNVLNLNSETVTTAG